MAMTKGTVTINPTTGAVSGTGAAREVFDAMDATTDYQGLVGPQLAVARQQLADLCNAVAEIIPHIQNNAQVSTSVSSTISLGSTANGVTAGAASVPVTGTSSGSGTGTVS